MRRHMRSSLMVLLPLVALALGGCGSIGGKRDDNAARDAAWESRFAAQQQSIQMLADELRADREARAAEALAAAPSLPPAEDPDPQPVDDPEPVAEDESADEDGNSDGTVVVTVVEDTVPVAAVAVPLADTSAPVAPEVGFAAEDRAKACVEDLMTTGAQVERPTSAVKAAYVCSHLYGLDHDRGLENRAVSHELTQDGKAFEANLEQRKARFQHVLNLDSADDSDYRLGPAGNFSLLPASLSADRQ